MSLDYAHDATHSHHEGRARVMSGNRYSVTRRDFVVSGGPESRHQLWWLEPQFGSNRRWHWVSMPNHENPNRRFA